MTKNTYINFDQATAATHLVVAPLDGSRKIRVKAFHLVAAGTVDVTIQSGSTKIGGLYALAANSQIWVPLVFGEGAYMETALGEPLNVLLGGGVQVGGFFVYEEA